MLHILGNSLRVDGAGVSVALVISGSEEEMTRLLEQLGSSALEVADDREGGPIRELCDGMTLVLREGKVDLP